MKFSTKEDVEAPIDAVFEMLCDFETFERAAMRRGAEVQRTDSKPVPEKPSEMEFECTSQGLLTLMSIELVALSKNRTRIMMTLDIKPLNLSARLLVQSLKLAKSSLTKKYKLRIAEFAKTLEERHKSA